LSSLPDTKTIQLEYRDGHSHLDIKGIHYRWLFNKSYACMMRFAHNSLQMNRQHLRRSAPNSSVSNAESPDELLRHADGRHTSGLGSPLHCKRFQHVPVSCQVHMLSKCTTNMEIQRTRSQTLRQSRLGGRVLFSSRSFGPTLRVRESIIFFSMKITRWSLHDPRAYQATLNMCHTHTSSRLM
jgi:hypothetical protein